MSALFLRVLSMSLTASWAALVALAARLLLTRAPKRFSYWLWAAPFARFLLPFGIKGAFSLVPEGLSASAGASGPLVVSAGSVQTALGSATIAAQSSAPAVTIAAAVWLAGAAALCVYNLASFIKLRSTLRSAARRERGVCECEGLRTAVVVGLARPRIYLPSALGAREREYILAHERAHIRRGDYILKPLLFAALCLHWFNPLAWAAYHFACEDIEASCDEIVLSGAKTDIRAEYSASLLALATGGAAARAPLAFSGGGIKVRIKRALGYKKPTVIISALCLAMTAAVCAGLLCDAPGALAGLASPISGQSYFTRPIAAEDLGVGIVGPEGSDVLAAAAGTVALSSYSENYGNFIVIDHGSGTRTLYAHNSEIFARQGDKVEAGQRIAALGMSGEAYVPTLHFAVQLDGEWVNPKEYVRF